MAKSLSPASGGSAPGRRPESRRQSARLVKGGGRAKAASDGGSLDKLLGLLGVFSSQRPIVSVDEMIEALALSKSSAYRYVKALTRAGLIAAVANGQYVLGPRIIQLDRQIRDFDPLYNAGGPLMDEYVRKTGHSALVSALYSHCVVCVRAALAPGAPSGLFSRGQTRSLIAGSSSRAILPYLPAHQLPKLYAAYARPIAAAGLGKDWSAFKEALASIRNKGYATSISEFNPGVMGISAPIFNFDRAVIGSFSVSIMRTLSPAEFETEAAHVVQFAGRVTAVLARIGAGVDLSPRAVGGRQKNGST
jgi:DNA-binding IclR family transcriptional regulator